MTHDDHNHAFTPDLRELADALDDAGRAERAALTESAVRRIAGAAASASSPRASSESADDLIAGLDALGASDRAALSDRAIEATARAASGARALRLVGTDQAADASRSGSGIAWLTPSRLLGAAASIAVVAGATFFLIRGLPAGGLGAGSPEMVTVDLTPAEFADDLAEAWDAFDGAFYETYPEEIAATFGGAAALEEAIGEEPTDWSDALLLSSGESS